MRDFGVVDGKLTAGNGPKTVLNSVQLLSSIFKHARRFKWIPTNPYKDVRKPRFKVKVRAFTAAEVATLAHHADESTALLIRTSASTGLRFGELAGLEWERVDLEHGAVQVRKQFTHGAWADLKTAHSRRRVPLAKELVKQLRRLIAFARPANCFSLAHQARRSIITTGGRASGCLSMTNC
jgi:integrase